MTLASRALQTEHGTVEYLVCGEGETLLAFHGALGNAESMQWFAHAFASEWRVIIPSLADHSDPDVIARCAAAVLDAEQVHRAALFGISFGGLVAQSFLDRQPDRVNSLVLMSCPPARRAASIVYRFAAAAAQHLPFYLIRVATRHFLLRQLATMDEANAAHRRAMRLHRARLLRIVSLFRKQTLVARLQLAASIHRAAAHRWDGPILLMVSLDDPLFSARAIARIGRSMPRAHIHRFEHGGHLIPLFHLDAMRSVMRTFFQATAPARRAPSAMA